MKYAAEDSKLDYLLCSHHSYTPTQRDELAVNSFEDSVAEISLNGSAFTNNNARAYDAIIPGIFGTLEEQVLTSTIKNEKYFGGFY